MKTGTVSKIAMLTLAPGLAWAAVLAPGLYRDTEGHAVYVGIENTTPDPPANEYYDPTTQHAGDLAAGSSLKPLRLLREDAAVIDAPGGQLGVSLYSAGGGKRATIVLIHGNDAETREMGFLIPYFALNGVNVISYDQRGTGKSTGNWQESGPLQRAADVEALYDAYSKNPRVASRRMGVWGFSNGGWTAPVVATSRPLAFMILKSAPAESIEANVYYTLAQQLHHQNYDAKVIASATNTWRALFDALSGKGSWAAARAQYEAASAEAWFKDAYLPYFYPPSLGFPPPAAAAAGLQRELFFDPAETLRKVRVPTLALFGALDRNVDVAHAPALFRTEFAHAGMRDFTIHLYRDAGHTLKVSTTGFNGEASPPERLTAGYPEIMIRWLRQRGLPAAAPDASNSRSN